MPPERTCIVCRQKRLKREFTRVVCNHEGKVEVDLSGKKSGRGAYICRNRACWELAIKKGRLAHALRTRIAPYNWVSLCQYADSLPEGLNETASIK